MSKLSFDQLVTLAVFGAGVVLVASLLFVIHAVTTESRTFVLFETFRPQPTATSSPTITSSPTASRLPSPTVTFTRPPLPTSTPSQPPRATITRTPTGSARKITPTPTRRTGATPTLTPSPTARVTAAPSAIPLPAATITSGVRFVSIIGAPPGGDARVTIQTVKGAACSLLFVTTSGAYTTPAGPDKQTADDKGIITWSWKIETTTQRGKGMVVATCGGASIESPVLIE